MTVGVQKERPLWASVVCEPLRVCINVRRCLTFDLRLDEVEHLAEAVLEGKGLDGHGLQLLTLLLVEVLQLVHAEQPVPVQVHAAEPVLYAGRREEGGMEVCVCEKRHVKEMQSAWL